ncbi:MmcQ/YjbR family DNA-binding protein [Paradevosia shaoguanensis]|uniref:MmcQ/YjbR family DNA-binding protein n=1 Tax=Paradevosia shaoguanensis TaxID=1335043 RepID=UPI0019342148|nr:MmcQ/YjbR family DNA-binding protein [Paradevosia shaoguanensis]
MSPDEIVALILRLPSTEQSSHFGNADFRVGGKIFASHPKPGQFNLNITPEQQAMLTEAEPRAFAALPNKWGEKGWTSAWAEHLDETTALSAFRMAWANVAPRALVNAELSPQAGATTTPSNGRGQPRQPGR